jgi:hypothetical protein
MRGETVMSLDVVMCFGVQARPYRAAVARAVRLVPSVAGGILEGCDVGVRTPARALLLRVHLTECSDTAAVVDRLAYWSARAHGFAVALRGDLAGASASVADALQASDPLEVAVGRAELPAVLDRALASLWPHGRSAAGAWRLHDPATCPPRTAGPRASRRPRKHSPGESIPSRSPSLTT